MSSHRSSLLASLLGFVALSAAAPAFSQSYGLGDQVLAIGAVDFRPKQSPATYATGPTDGYIYGAGQYVAPLHLPDGAEIFQICVYANVSGADTFVDTEIQMQKLTPGAENPGVVPVLASYARDNVAVGYDQSCSAPFSFVVQETADVDGDGITDHVAYSVIAGISDGTAIGLGGVRVFWRRQVSPAPATATFNDVPTTDSAFAFIEALAASGITAGCAGGNYCPDAPLTRRQMAVFLGKALGLHWAN